MCLGCLHHGFGRLHLCLSITVTVGLPSVSTSDVPLIDSIRWPAFELLILEVAESKARGIQMFVCSSSCIDAIITKSMECERGAFLLVPDLVSKISDVHIIVADTPRETGDGSLIWADDFVVVDYY